MGGGGAYIVRDGVPEEWLSTAWGDDERDILGAVIGDHRFQALYETLIILVTSRPRDQDRLLSSLLLSSPAVCVLLLGLAPGLLYSLLLVTVLQPELVTSEVSLCWLDITSPSLSSLFMSASSQCPVSVC